MFYRILVNQKRINNLKQEECFGLNMRKVNYDGACIFLSRIDLWTRKNKNINLEKYGKI